MYHSEPRRETDFSEGDLWVNLDIEDEVIAFVNRRHGRIAS